MVIADRIEPAVGRAREFLVGGCLAALLSAHSILVLCYALVGSDGNSVFTGLVLTSILASLLALGSRSDIRLGPMDYLFVAFLACIVVSIGINGSTAEPKEWLIFATSLAAYPACRAIPRSQLATALPTFIWITGIIAAIGTVLTVLALFAQWYGTHGKVEVSGFPSAPTNFLTSFGFLLIALVVSGLSSRKTMKISAAIFLPVAIFAASQIRFTFIAILGSLCVAAIMSRQPQRKFIAIITTVVIAGMLTGLAARYSTSAISLGFALEENQEVKTARVISRHGLELRPPSCALKVNGKNSIAIRKALMEDAIYLVPFAGPFGFGLDSFEDISCMRTEVHNSPLEGIIEFGWIGGTALILLTVFSLALLRPVARRSNGSMFVLCSLAYIAAISLAHGRSSADILLYASLGLAAGNYETRTGTAGRTAA